KLPSKYAAAKNSYDTGAIVTSFQAKHTVENLGVLGGALGAGLESCSKRQRTRQGRSHSRDQRSQGRVASSRSTSRKRSTTSNSRKKDSRIKGKLLGWKGTPNVRGRRSIRSRQKPAAKMDAIISERHTPKDITEETPIFVIEEINEGETEANARNGSNVERSDYEGDLYGETDEYHHLVDNNNNNDGYKGGFNGKSENLIEQSHYNVDDEKDVDMDDDNSEEDEQVDLNTEDYIIGGDSDTGYNREENEEHEDLDGDGSTSSDCSD
ncbi:hypothetical protein A2U01_0018002, partial [Trifolium medium]|nr:hypothetical protein [Trifolium medium]